MESGSKTFMLNSQVVNFTFIFWHCHQKLRICLFSCQESMNDLIDIGVTCSSSNLLESIFDNIVLVHFTLHLSFQECREESLNQELFLHLYLILIFIFVSCHLCNFRLSFHSLHSSSKCIFLVSNGLLQALDSFLSFSLIHFNFHHDLIELHLGLDSFLLSLSLFIRFIT